MLGINETCHVNVVQTEERHVRESGRDSLSGELRHKYPGSWTGAFREGEEGTYGWAGQLSGGKRVD